MDRQHIIAFRELIAFVDEQLPGLFARDRQRMANCLSLVMEAVEDLDYEMRLCEHCHAHPAAPPSDFCQVCIDLAVRGVHLGIADLQPSVTIPY